MPPRSVLDLHDQWQRLREDRAIPLHAADPRGIVAPHRALTGILRRGGQPARGRAPCADNPPRPGIDAGMRALGLRAALSATRLQAPIIVNSAFRMPSRARSSSLQGVLRMRRRSAAMIFIRRQAYRRRQLPHRLQRGRPNPERYAWRPRRHPPGARRDVAWPGAGARRGQSPDEHRSANTDGFRVQREPRLPCLWQDRRPRSVVCLDGSGARLGHQSARRSPPGARRLVSLLDVRGCSRT